MPEYLINRKHIAAIHTSTAGTAAASVTTTATVIAFVTSIGSSLLVCSVEELSISPPSNQCNADILSRDDDFSVFNCNCRTGTRHFYYISEINFMNR